MSNFLNAIALIALVLAAVYCAINFVFWLLYKQDEEFFPVDEPDKPVAWRIRRGNRYYYMDKSEPFPVEDAEPLFLGKTK